MNLNSNMKINITVKSIKVKSIINKRLPVELDNAVYHRENRLIK